MISGGKVSSGSVSFKPMHFDSMHCRYTRFRRWLGTRGLLIRRRGLEAVRQHNGTEPPLKPGFMAILQTWCDAKGFSYEGVPVGTIKKFVTGNGNASKLAMTAAMERRGHKPHDDNEADALELLYWRLEAANLNQQERSC